MVIVIPTSASHTDHPTEVEHCSRGAGQAGEEEMWCRVEASGDGGQGLHVVQRDWWRQSSGWEILEDLVAPIALDQLYTPAWRVVQMHDYCSVLMSTRMSAVEHKSELQTVDPSRVMGVESVYMGRLDYWWASDQLLTCRHTSSAVQSRQNCVIGGQVP